MMNFSIFKDTTKKRQLFLCICFLDFFGNIQQFDFLLKLFLLIKNQKIQRSMQIGNRDLDKIDPDWKFAYFHAKSTRPGICTEEHPQICDCCLNIIHKEPVDLGVHAKELQFMGFGFPLWYSFLKYCIILLLILIVSECCVSVFQAIDMNKQLCIDQYNKYVSKTFLGVSYSNHPHHNFEMTRHFSHDSDKAGHHSGIQESNVNSNQHPQTSSGSNRSPKQTKEKSPKKSEGQNSLIEKNRESGHHHGHHCTGVFILLSRIDAQIDDLQAVLRVSTFIIIMFTLLFIRDTIYKTEKYYDERRCSLGDYSIIIQHLPAVDGIQKSIRRFFSEGLSEEYKVQELILVPELDQLENIQHQKDHYIKEMQKLYKKGKQNNQQQVQKIQKQLQEFEEKQSRAMQTFRHQLQNDHVHSESAIIVLSNQPQKEKLLAEFEQYDKENLIQFFGPQAINIEIQQAPQPREIIWQNMNYPYSKRLGRVILGWFLSIAFIAVITAVFYFILKYKTHIVEQKQVKEATIIVFTALILVILFNKFVMGYVLHHFTHIEKHATSDNEQFSFAFKYALGMFFTTALMTLFVEALTYNNFYQHHYGVIEQESIMFFMNSLLVPIIWAINPFQIYVLIKRKIYFGKKYFTQREANHLMEDFNYDVGKRYAEVLQSMWFTFLYASLIPMGAFLTAIGIGLYYWVDKYNLLRRSSIHENVSGKLSLIALKLLDLVLVFYPLGQIIFDHFLRHETLLSSIIQLIVSIIYLCLPLNDIIDFFNKENFNLEEKTYRQVKHTFKDNYYSLHPMYSKTHLNETIQSRNHYKKSVLELYGNPVFSFAMGWLSNGKNTQTFSNYKQGKSNADRDTMADERNSIGGSNPFFMRFSATH